MKKNDAVYVLGVDYQVINCVSWQTAIVHVLSGRMSPVRVHSTRRIRSQHVDMAFPEWVKLNDWRPIPRKKAKNLNTRATSREILRRDKFVCAYCGESGATTVDHITPESRCKKLGLEHNGWTYGNLVAACKSCNQEKADRTPEEAGMVLLFNPYVVHNKFSQVQREVDAFLRDEDFEIVYEEFEGFLV